jgi:hypothetical protein
MSWIPLLLAAWLIVDALVIVAIVVTARGRRRVGRAAGLQTLTPHISARSTSRLVH